MPLEEIDTAEAAAMQMSFIIQMVLTIACENREFVKETLGKLRRSKIYERHSSVKILLLNDARKHFKGVGKTYMIMWRLYFKSRGTRCLLKVSTDS